LTLEFIPGRKLSQALPGLSADRRKQLAQNLIDAYIYMALEDRFFHADPHAGNFLLTPAGKLAFIDAGQVGRLDSETVAAFTDMLLALANQDTEALVDAYLRLGTAEEGLDRRSLARDAALFMEQYYDLPVARISVGSSLQEVVELSLKHRIQLPADFVVLVKTFLGAEGMARRLNPKLNLVEAAQPMATSIMRRRYEPRQLAERAVRQMQDLRRFMSSLPARLQDLLDKLQRGHFKMEFEHKGLEDLRYDLDRTGNRLSVALVVAALIMGSAWILASQIGPQWGGFSVLGLAGFVLAGVFGLLLILAILRSGRM
jgi:ubiquinone biosynthesis protein